jgi:hypothetical protein
VQYLALSTTPYATFSGHPAWLLAQPRRKSVLWENSAGAHQSIDISRAQKIAARPIKLTHISRAKIHPIPKSHKRSMEYALPVLPSPLQLLASHPVVATVMTNCSELVRVIETTAYNLICC